MKILHIVSVLLFGGLAASFVSTATAAASPAPAVFAKVGVVNTYRGYGTGAMFDDNPAVQSLLLVEYPNGLNFSLWNHNNFKGWNESLGTEVDYGAGWSGEVAPYVKLDLGLTYFDEPDVFKLGKGDVLYGKAYLSRNIFGVITSFGYEDYVTMPNSGFEGGRLYSVGFSKSTDFDGGRVSLSSSIALVYDDGGFGFPKGFLGRGVATLSWKINDSWTLTAPEVFYFYSRETPSEKRKFHTMVYSGIAYKF